MTSLGWWFEQALYARGRREWERKKAEEEEKDSQRHWNWLKTKKGWRRVWMTQEEFNLANRQKNKRSGKSEERRMEWYRMNRIVEEVGHGWIWVMPGPGDWTVVDDVGGWRWV